MMLLDLNTAIFGEEYKLGSSSAEGILEQRWLYRGEVKLP
jgi:hypothetical protein